MLSCVKVIPLRVGTVANAFYAEMIIDPFAPVTLGYENLAKADACYFSGLYIFAIL